MFVRSEYTFSLVISARVFYGWGMTRKRRRAKHPKLSEADLKELTAFKDFIRDVAIEKKPPNEAYADRYGEVVFEKGKL